MRAIAGASCGASAGLPWVADGVQPPGWPLRDAVPWLWVRDVLGTLVVSAGIAAQGRWVPFARAISARPFTEIDGCRRRSVLSGQHEHRNLSLGLGLVSADVRVLRDQSRPQLGAGGVVQLLRQDRGRLGTHLDFDSR